MRGGKVPRPLSVGLQVFSSTDPGIDGSIIAAATLMSSAQRSIGCLFLQRQLVQKRSMRAGLRQPPVSAQVLEKLKSNMQEVRARGGELYVFADSDTRIDSGPGVHVIRMPEHYGALSPILHVVPLQLLAYHTACARGTDVDKPQNLAKSVTVE